MDTHDRPCLGFLQPGTGFGVALSCADMAKPRKSKKNRPPAAIRAILANNVRSLRDALYAGEPNETARNRALADKVGTKLSQIQRICDADLGTSIDSVEWLAEALQVRPHDLLTPYFAAERHAQSMSVAPAPPPAPRDNTRKRLDSSPKDDPPGHPI